MLREKPGQGHVPGHPKDPKLLKTAKLERQKADGSAVAGARGGRGSRWGLAVGAGTFWGGGSTLTLGGTDSTQQAGR